MFHVHRIQLQPPRNHSGPNINLFKKLTLPSSSFHHFKEDVYLKEPSVPTEPCHNALFQVYVFEVPFIYFVPSLPLPWELNL